MSKEASLNNPYSNRNLPVGCGWTIPEEDAAKIKPVRKSAMLEFGEEEFLYDLSRLVGPGQYANLGDARGGSAALMALGLKNRRIEGHVHTVDTYRDGFTDSLSRGKARCKQNAAKFKGWGVMNYITQYRMTTLEAYKEFEAAGVRFKAVFIDADHSYEGVKEDLLHYALILDSPGYILFHDTNQEYTNKVIEEFIDTNPCISLVHWVNRIKCYVVV